MIEFFTIVGIFVMAIIAFAILIPLMAGTWQFWTHYVRAFRARRVPSPKEKT